VREEIRKDKKEERGEREICDCGVKIKEREREGVGGEIPLVPGGVSTRDKRGPL
jgi:hypothetical protein